MTRSATSTGRDHSGPGVDRIATCNLAVPPDHRPAAPLRPDTTLAEEITALSGLDLYDLRVRWRKLMRKPAPEHLNRSLLIRFIAYRMQARAYGDLDAESIRALDRIAREHDRNRASGKHTATSVP